MENKDIIKARIQKILNDIKVYEQAITDAQNAPRIPTDVSKLSPNKRL